jgi:hypothetical protein
MPIVFAIIVSYEANFKAKKKSPELLKAILVL